MASEKSPVTLSASTAQESRRPSPPPSRFRHRQLSRTAASGEVGSSLNHRRGSLFSDTISETRRSFRSSTDDLFLPRVRAHSGLRTDHEPSHWHSVPLGLALLPAVGGLFFQNGSAVVTDVTLLALAAIFLNWSVRLPW